MHDKLCHKGMKFRLDGRYTIKPSAWFPGAKKECSSLNCPGVQGMLTRRSIFYYIMYNGHLVETLFQVIRNRLGPNPNHNLNTLQNRKEAFYHLLDYCLDRNLKLEHWDVHFCQGSSKQLKTNERTKAQTYANAWEDFASKRKMRALSENCVIWTAVVEELPPCLWSGCPWPARSQRGPLTSWLVWRTSNSQPQFPMVLLVTCRLAVDGWTGTCESSSEIC